MTSLRSELPLYRRWIWANGWAELVGLGGTLLLGWLGSRWFGEGPDGVAAAVAGALAAVVMGTVLEGVVVGYAQGRVLHQRLEALPVRAWVRATAIGAGIAWALGMIPSTVASLGPPSNSPPPAFFDGPLQYLLAAGLGLVLGVVLAFPQWLVLRGHCSGAAWWISANALAWAIGMPLVFLGMGTLPIGVGPVRAIATVTAICLATGLLVGAVHGLALVRLLAADGAGPKPA